MPARVLDGKALAAKRNETTKATIEAHLEQVGRAPRLDVILVGSDEASEIYVRNKVRKAKQVGIEGNTHPLDATVSAEAVQQAIDAVQANEDVDGIILQLPLPDGMDPHPLLARIDPGRDVDGFHPLNTGRLLSGIGGGFMPATPLGITWFLDEEHKDLAGTEVVIVSHSNLIGRPLAAALIERDATVTVCHEFTRDLRAHTTKADVLVTAAGVPGLITGDHVQEGATVIDAATVLGPDGRLRGDTDPETVAMKAGALTPVPGGVGPVTVSALLYNTVTAWRRRNLPALARSATPV